MIEMEETYTVVRQFAIRQTLLVCQWLLNLYFYIEDLVGGLSLDWRVLSTREDYALFGVITVLVILITIVLFRRGKKKL